MEVVTVFSLFKKKKKTAELTINFYDSTFNTADSTEISIVYTGATDDMEILSYYFIEYYHQVSVYLQNLGSFKTANSLWKIIKSSYEKGFSKENNLLDSEFYKGVLVSPRQNATRIEKGTFYENKTVSTSFSWGGENFYLPVSVIVFLQYIINVSTDENIKVFNDNIKKIVTQP
jgi:hypothetical protein